MYLYPIPWDRTFIVLVTWLSPREWREYAVEGEWLDVAIAREPLYFRVLGLEVSFSR